MTDHDKVRLDKWLWAARFFKTRALAAEAISGGKIHINGTRAKPAHAVNPGDEMQIRKGPYQFTVAVKEISRSRGPASVAALLYEETPASIASRQQLAEQHRLLAATGPQPGERPTKRQRRQIARFTGRGE
ncbi:MAG: S4 domain-containing protein [Pseudomonadota bacterium]